MRWAGKSWFGQIIIAGARRGPPAKQACCRLTSLTPAPFVMWRHVGYICRYTHIHTAHPWCTHIYIHRYIYRYKYMVLLFYVLICIIICYLFGYLLFIHAICIGTIYMLLQLLCIYVYVLMYLCILCIYVFMYTMYLCILCIYVFMYALYLCIHVYYVFMYMFVY